MKLPPENLNPYPYPQHSTNTYTCRVTIAQGCAVVTYISICCGF